MTAGSRSPSRSVEAPGRTTGGPMKFTEYCALQAEQLLRDMVRTGVRSMWINGLAFTRLPCVCYEEMHFQITKLSKELRNSRGGNCCSTIE